MEQRYRLASLRRSPLLLTGAIAAPPQIARAGRLLLVGRSERQIGSDAGYCSPSEIGHRAVLHSARSEAAAAAAGMLLSR